MLACLSARRPLPPKPLFCPSWKLISCRNPHPARSQIQSQTAMASWQINRPAYSPSCRITALDTSKACSGEASSDYFLEIMATYYGVDTDQVQSGFNLMTSLPNFPSHAFQLTVLCMKNEERHSYKEQSARRRIACLFHHSRRT